MPTYSYRITPPRPDFVATMDVWEKAIMGRHWEFVEGLHRTGWLSFLGRAENGDFGFCVFDAEDWDQAEYLVHSDPAVGEGLMQVEIHEFKVVFATRA